MLSNFKGLPNDNSIIDLISSSYFSHEPQIDHEVGQIFIQPSLDIYNSVAEDIHTGLLSTQLHQDYNKIPHSPKKEFHLPHKIQINQKSSVLGFRTDQEMLEGTKHDKADDDDDDDDADNASDSGSNTNSAKKRGKYRTYTEEEKAHIISFMAKHGIQQTIEIFSGGEHKITKRKLKSWLDSQNKVKGVKGRKSNDPARDRALHGWCMDFQNEHGRPPSRKEATQKALDLSGDPNFQASKGWLDKFSRKYNIEFTPLKIIPPRGKKKVKTTIDSEPVSAVSTQGSTLTDLLSPIKDTKMKPKEAESKMNTILTANEGKAQENFLKINPVFGFNAKQVYQQPQQQQQQSYIQPPSQQQQYQQQQHQQHQLYPQMPVNGLEGNFSSLDPSLYQAFSSLEQTQTQNFPYSFSYPLEYPMSYSLNYPKVYPRNSYPMNYSMNLPMNYPVGFAENFQRLHQIMKKENDMNIEKTN